MESAWVVDLLLSTSRWVASRHKPDDTAYMVIMCDKLPDLLLFFFQNRQDYLKDEELTFERHSGIPITVVKEEQFSIQLQAAIGI